MQAFDFGELDELYREVVLDHYRNPRNRGRVKEPDIEAEGFNPFCGDEISLQLKLDGDGRIREVGFQGQGCSISQASASMMTEVLKGKSLADARRLIGIFKGMMHGKVPDEAELSELGDLEALQGVRKFPIRIKCALLAWTTLEEGLERFKG